MAKGSRYILLGITESTEITGNSCVAATASPLCTEALAEDRLIDVAAGVLGETRLVFRGLNLSLARTW